MPLDPQLDPVFDAAGRAYNVDPQLLKAVAREESGGNAAAISSAGAEGLMQLLPSTAKVLNITDTKDPAQSIWGGAEYLSQGLRKYGDPVRALMYYHGGPDETQWGPKTQAYPALVAGNYAPQTQPKRMAMNGSSLSGTDALAAVARPQSQNIQVAGAGDLSDDDIINGYISGKLPLPAGTSQLKGSPSSSQEAPSSPGQPLVSLADPNNALYPPQIRGALMGFPDGQRMLSQIIEEEKAGFQRNRDGTMSPIAGGPADPNVQYQSGQAGTLGKNLQQRTPKGVQNLPGATEAEAGKAGAVAAAQNTEKIEITRDGGIYKGGVYIGHAPKMTDVVDAQGNKYPAFTPPIGQVGPGVAPPSIATNAPSGANLPSGATPPPGAVMNSPSELGPGQHEALSKGEELSSETYNDARKSFLGNQAAIQNLKNYLEAASKVGTGRGTNFSGNAAAWLKSINVDPDALALADPSQVQIMQKAANQMLASAVRAISSRPAFADFGVLEKGLPDPEKQPEAQKQIAASLLGRMNWENQLFTDWDANKRLTGSPSQFDLPAWANAHPTQGFQLNALEQMPAIPQRGLIGKTETTPQYYKGQTGTNPQTGEKWIFDGQRWNKQ